MPNCSESLRSGGAARCAVCDGKFGLVRYYSWKAPLCSKKCVDRLKARRQSDFTWMVASESLSTSRQKPREGVMTLQISQRGKQYLETARTLLRAAQTMTDRAVAGQLRALADDYQQRAEKASLDDAKHCSIRCSTR